MLDATIGLATWCTALTLSTTSQWQVVEPTLSNPVSKDAKQNLAALNSFWLVNQVTLEHVFFTKVHVTRKFPIHMEDSTRWDHNKSAHQRSTMMLKPWTTKKLSHCSSKKLKFKLCKISLRITRTTKKTLHFSSNKIKLTLWKNSLTTQV